MMLSYKNYRSEFEREVLNIIIRQTKNFTYKDIYNELRIKCDKSIQNDYIADIIYVSLDFCLNQGYLNQYGEGLFYVSNLNRYKFEAFIYKLNAKDYTVQNTL